MKVRGPGEPSKIDSAAKMAKAKGNGREQVTLVLVVNEPNFIRDCLLDLLHEDNHPFEIHCLRQGAMPSATAPLPDVVIVNVNAASVFDATVEADFRQLASIVADAPLLVISERDDLSEALKAIDLGASGYFVSSLSVNLLVAAIRLILAGGTFLPPGLLQQVLPRSQLLPGTGYVAH
jgi:DNA-binding NarL/FixJ family response regulator